MAAAGQAKGAPFAGPRAKVRKARSAGTGTLRTGNRPWPGIAGDRRADCSCPWAWRGEKNRMEVKFANAACPVYAHSRGVTDLTTGDSDERALPAE